MILAKEELIVRKIIEIIIMKIDIDDNSDQIDEKIDKKKTQIYKIKLKNYKAIILCIIECHWGGGG